MAVVSLHFVLDRTGDNQVVLCIVVQVLDSEHDQDEGTVTNRRDIEELMEDLDLDNLSESEPEMDTISVLSTPKPKLR